MDAYTERRIIPPLVVRFAWLVTDFVCCSPMHPNCSGMHPYVKLGSRLFFTREKLEGWIESNSVPSIDAGKVQ